MKLPPACSSRATMSATTSGATWLLAPMPVSAYLYGFVRQSGGDARIVSAPGKGTTVELSFPLPA